MTNIVVKEARSWIGTPFHHQGCIKGIAADCVGLIKGVATALNRVPTTINLTAYSEVPDGVTLMKKAEEYLIRVSDDNMTFGDIVVVRFNKSPQHVGFIANYKSGGFSIIHASSNEGKVIETRLMFSNYMRYVAAFRLPED